MYRKKHYSITKKCTVYEESYGRSLSKVLGMFREAKSDFPRLTEGDIEVIEIVSPTNGRLIGIRFDVRKGDKVPSSYERFSG